MTKKRYDRPGLFWAITRVRRIPAVYVTMRVTRITPERIYGGVEDIGTYRKPDEVYGRFETRDVAGRKAAELNFVLARYTNAFRELHEQFAALEEAGKALSVNRDKELTLLIEAFPRMALMQDRFGKV